MNIKGVVRLKEGERVLRVVREFWLAYAARMLLAFALVAAPFFFMVPLFSLGIAGAVTFGFVAGVGILYGARVFYVWYWNTFVVTTFRVLDIDQRGLFSRTVSEADHTKIQDVSYNIHGVLGTVLKVGTIVIQTAGTTTNLELAHVRDPKEVHHLITETMQALQMHSRGGARSEKVAHLLDAASELSDAEARAFLVAIQEATSEPKTLGWKQKDVEGAMLSSDETEDPETIDGDS